MKTNQNEYPVSSVEQKFNREAWEPAGVIHAKNETNYGSVENLDGEGGLLDLEVGKRLRKITIPKE